MAATRTQTVSATGRDYSTCFKCKGHGHWARDCPSGSGGAAASPKKYGGGAPEGDRSWAKSFNTLKEHGGQTYTGMRIGGEHRWKYSDSSFTERATDDVAVADFEYDSTKTREKNAPNGSGAEDNTIYHWYVVAEMSAKEEKDGLAVNIQGSKFKVGHKRPHWKGFSYSYARDQLSETEQKAKFIQQVLAEDATKNNSTSVVGKRKREDDDEAPASSPKRAKVEDGPWACPACTFVNIAAGSGVCDICQHARPTAMVGKVEGGVKAEAKLDACSAAPVAMKCDASASTACAMDACVKDEPGVKPEPGAERLIDPDCSSKLAGADEAAAELEEVVKMLGPGATMPWQTTEGKWVESKLEPDRWHMDFNVKFNMEGAPKAMKELYASSRIVVVADQMATKVNANQYKTEMKGKRYLCGAKGTPGAASMGRAVLERVLAQVSSPRAPSASPKKEKREVKKE